jgi:hypothetical protein
MECIVRIEMDNAAFFNFDTDGESVRDCFELVRLLRGAADMLAMGSYAIPGGSLDLRDYNGNLVGSIDFEEE